MSHSETGCSQGGEERKTLQIIFRDGIAEENGFCALWNAKHKRFKRFVQHRGVFLPIVSEPPFPQSISPNAVVGNVGLVVRDNVFDVLPRTQFASPSKQLL